MLAVASDMDLASDATLARAPSRKRLRSDAAARDDYDFSSTEGAQDEPVSAAEEPEEDELSAKVTAALKQQKGKKPRGARTAEAAEIRRERNRIHAKMSRDRKKEMLQKLQVRVLSIKIQDWCQQ